MASALVSVMVEQLVQFAVVEQGLRVFGEDIESLVNTLTHTRTIIEEVLEDAEEKQLKYKAVKDWFENLKYIYYDVEDVLDEWGSLIPNTQQSDLFNYSHFKQVFIRKYIGFKIDKLNKRLVRIVEMSNFYKFIQIPRDRVGRRPTSSYLVDVYGRDGDRDTLMSKLLSESSGPDSCVPVISIVGSGGLGKTTLAHRIFNEEAVVKTFDKRMWVHVSNHLLVEKVAKEIIQQAQGHVPNSVSWQALLEASVRGKRFILVLDDVWSCPSEEWGQLKNALDCGAAGSRIIVTSRSATLDKIMKSSHLHLLEPLTEDDSWALFKCIAFSGWENDLGTFEDIGKEISKKCEGVPISVKVIASVMCLRKTIEEWRDVLGSYIWKVEKEGLLHAILLSYYALPSNLKPCLMYSAVFPKYAVIKKEEIVRLWMAQGYLGSDGSADLERIGRDNFDDLVMLSFFQQFKRGTKDKLVSYKMHDRVHDCVQFLTKTETIILEEERFHGSKVRHLYARDLGQPYIYKQNKLRTIISWSSLNSTLALELLHKWKCLRVLSLCHSRVKKLPSEVEQLLNLRYLDMSDSSMLEILPETICNLHNLQTLNLKRCKSLTRLPDGIGKLLNLRHLEIEGCEFRPYYSHRGIHYFPPGIGKLSCLRTLDAFIVGVTDATDAKKNKEGSTIGELKLLKHLQGHLKISGLGQVTAVGDAAEAELKMKEKLGSLVLDFGWKQEKEEEVTRLEEIVDALRPHTNLEKLVIIYYQGIRLPDWISSLSNLTALTLMDLRQCLQLPALGKLASLEFLHLNGLVSVKSLGCEFYGLGDTLNRQVIFPKLKKLIISSMPNLEELDLAFQNGVDFFPNLRELIIRDFFLSLRKLRIGWLPGLPKLPGFGKLNSLETLELSRMDVVDLSCLLLPLLHDNPNNYPNLKYFKISDSPQSSLPKGFNLLTSIQQLVFHNCEVLDFMADDLKHLNMLKQLEIRYCPVLAGRFSKGDISSSSSHYYKIFIRQEQQKPTETEKSSQSDVNVHGGIFCEMYPIDVIWNTPEVLNCYNTPSKHPDLANQHHIQGDTFDHISNCGDSSGPKHLAKIEEQNKA